VTRSLDVIVVGAGILGLATARELLGRYPGVRLVVVDKEGAVGRHQTGHNSGVVHAGIYYAPGSLKARLCVAGAARMTAFCEEHGIRLEHCGKLIVAASAEELPRLDALEERGRANNVPGLRRLSSDEIREVEPHCVGVAALHSPATGIVDFGEVAQRLADDVRTLGGRLALAHDVLDVRDRPDSVELAYRGGTLRARNAVFCAGAWGDRLAARAGVESSVRIVPFRGGYLRLKPHASRLVQGLIYPVPDPALPFLGVHLTRHAGGGVWLGPTALLVGARDAYALHRIRGRDIAETLVWPGTWRMMRRYWRSGVEEVSHAVSRRSFVSACARYVPELTVAHVESGMAGIRAQAVGRDGRLVDDFVFGRGERSLHVLNAPSPAATASLAIAELIAERAAVELSLGSG